MENRILAMQSIKKKPTPTDTVTTRTVLSIAGTFDVNKNCIPPLVAEDFTFPNNTTLICKEP